MIVNQVYRRNSGGKTGYNGEETGIFYTGIRIFALYEFGIVLYNR